MKHTYKEIWDTLSKIDVSEYQEEKMGLSYLSWSRAWWLLCQSYPEATYSFSKPEKGEDGTYEVGCTIFIGDCSRMATLPVMDYKNKAIVNPDYRQINDNKQRCFVKALAYFGLGIKLYMGFSDDLPDAEKDKASEKKETKKAEVTSITKAKANADEVITEAKELTGEGVIPNEETEESYKGSMEAFLKLLPLKQTKQGAREFYLTEKNQAFVKSMEKNYPDMHNEFMQKLKELTDTMPEADANDEINLEMEID